MGEGAAFTLHVVRLSVQGDRCATSLLGTIIRRRPRARYGPAFLVRNGLTGPTPDVTLRSIDMRRTLHCLFSIGALAVLSACAQPDRFPADSVADAWRRQPDDSTSPPPGYRLRPRQETPTGHAASATGEPLLARVNGRPIPRRHVVDLLLRTHGPAVLEQLIGLEAALAAAAENGIRITDADVEAETERSLRNLSNPLSSVTDGDMDRETAERLLDRVLTQRNISREVFRVVMRRNALLRRIVQSQLHVTDQQLRDEYERAYGERVQVRHIQLATPAEASRVQERLANGGNFVELAKLHSANQITAQRGGLLDSFSRREDMLASHFRDVAFALEPGRVSDAVRLGEWYHLIKLERRLPATYPEFASVRADLEARLRERLSESAMLKLYEKLFRESRIEVFDPMLRAAFERKHRRSPG